MACGRLSATVPGVGREWTGAGTPEAGWPEASLFPQRPAVPGSTKPAPQCSERAPRSPSRGCGRPGLPGSAGRRSQGTPRASRGRADGCRPSTVLGPCRGSGTLPSGRGMQAMRSSQKSPADTTVSNQLAWRRVRYLPSRPLRMPGGAAAGNPGPLPAGGPQAKPEPRQERGVGAASRGAAALPAGGFSVSFRALAGTGLPRAQRGRGR